MKKQAMKKIEWKCPKCGAGWGGHGRGGAAECITGPGCDGLFCDCDDPQSGCEEHGETQAHPCPRAVCDHCGWEGVYPPPPKRLQAWEKKALEAGWTPPDGWTGGAK